MGELQYGFKKHDATRLHYDLRLEHNGVLLSFALPIGPSYVAGVPREAIEMEDHRLKNLTFEGLHETGPIMLWDCGLWRPHPESEDVAESLRKGRIDFTLHGDRLRGGWRLVRRSGAKKTLRVVWDLYKLADAFARNAEDRCVLEEFPNSFKTGRSLEQIRHDWIAPPNRFAQQTRLFDGMSF